MPNTAEADKRLVAWIKERTDRQLERIMEAPEDGLTNQHYTIYRESDGVCRGCLAGWAGNWKIGADDTDTFEEIGAGDATQLLSFYGLDAVPPRMRDPDEHRQVFRRIKAYVAAELLTRRVNRKRLPAPQASADGMGELYALEAE